MGHVEETAQAGRAPKGSRKFAAFLAMGFALAPAAAALGRLK